MTSGFVDYVNRIILGKVKIYVCQAKHRNERNSKLRVFRIFYFYYLLKMYFCVNLLNY